MNYYQCKVASPELRPLSAMGTCMCVLNIFVHSICGVCFVRTVGNEYGLIRYSDVYRPYSGIHGTSRVFGVRVCSVSGL